jgi:hypothetical protein
MGPCIVRYIGGIYDQQDVTNSQNLFLEKLYMFRAIIVHHQELGTVCAAVRCISVRFSLQSAMFQVWCFGGGRVLCVVARGSEVQMKRCISFGCVMELFTGRCVCLVVLTGPVGPTLCCPANGVRLGLRFLDGGTHFCTNIHTSLH